jgi:hypothetical protein
VNTLDLVKDLAIILGGMVAFTTFVTGVLEYAKQNHLRRAEQFVEMRRRFLETPLFRDILNRIVADDPSLAEMPVQDRRNFIGFLEEVALLTNSGLIRPDVAHYMFGYYVLLSDRNEYLWAGLDKPGRYWTLFRSFAETMRSLEERPLPMPKAVRI